jgi:hypothetical protein
MTQIARRSCRLARREAPLCPALAKLRANPGRASLGETYNCVKSQKSIPGAWTVICTQCWERMWEAKVRRDEAKSHE